MHRPRLRLTNAVLLSTVVVTFAVACGDDDTPNPQVDAGEDTGVDTGVEDAGSDSALPDSGSDASVEDVSIIASPTSGLRTSEAGGSDVFTIVLSHKPTANVTVAIVSSDTTEGTVNPSVLTFTANNWNAPQTVTVTGVDDDTVDGDQPYMITTVPAGSTDQRYAGLTASAVNATNVDNESAGVTVAAGTTPLRVFETGTTASFTIVLNTAPSADVTIPLSSDDETEGTVSPASLTFTVDNWNAPQTVTVTGVDDDEADGSTIFYVITEPAQSADVHYEGVDADDVTVENIDNETANVIVSVISGATSESGTTATFTVALTSAPTANVTLGISSSDESEGTVSPATLTFTTANWQAAQTVTVTGVDDQIADGNQPYAIIFAPAQSADSDYHGHQANDVQVINLDNDSPGVLVSAASGPTSENGGSATFSVVLVTQPSANVTFPLSVSDATEGEVDVNSLTFTTDNWNAPQTVTVTGRDDSIADGHQVYRVIIGAGVSDDDNYDGLDPADVTLTNTDDETPGITVSAISGDVSESGTSATFTLVLDSQPSATVTIGLSSDDTTEATVTPSSVVFDANNWNAPFTVTVTGVNDDLDDGTQTFHIITAAAVSADSNYHGLNAQDVEGHNVDNDTAGVTVSTAGTGSTSEAGGTTTFTIVLNSRPSADVTIDISSSDITEGTVSPSSVVFTVDNWNAARTITVTGVNDAITDGDQVYTIVTSATVSVDESYSGLPVDDVTITNIDNETPGIIVSGVTGNTTEAGGTATLTIVLNSEPRADVTIALSSSDITEGVVSPSSLTFTSANWNAPQLVTVTGVNDFVADGNQVYRVVTAPAVSADSEYSGIDAPNRTVTNIDDETAGITLSNASSHTTEAGGTAIITIVLNSQPLSDVTINLSSSDTTEGTVAPSSVTFTPDTWNMSRNITVTGVDDFLADNAQTYSVVTAPAISADPSYSGMNARDVSVINDDNDSPGFLITPVVGATTEDGDTATFMISLTAQPSASVRINAESSDLTEGTVSPSSYTFTAVNWNMPRTFTVTGVNDNAADGNQPYTIRLLPAVSSDLSYSGLDPQDIQLVNQDNDSVVILVTGISGDTTEAGGTATFLIALTSQPTAPVTIGISSSDTTEGTVSAPSVTFNVANWNSPRMVTVTGVDDDENDGDVRYTIITAAAVSADPSYNGVNPSNVSVFNIDDD